MLLIAVLPFVRGDIAIFSLIGLCALISFFVVFRNPAWSEIMVDIVPQKIRGRFFGRRNSLMSLFPAITILAGGFILDTAGFSAIFVIGAILGALSIPFIMKLKVPINAGSYNFRKLIRIRPN